MYAKICPAGFGLETCMLRLSDGRTTLWLHLEHYRTCVAANSARIYDRLSTENSQTARINLDHGIYVLIFKTVMGQILACLTIIKKRYLYIWGRHAINPKIFQVRAIFVHRKCNAMNGGVLSCFLTTIWIFWIRGKNPKDFDEFVAKKGCQTCGDFQILEGSHEIRNFSIQFSI